MKFAWQRANQYLSAKQMETEPLIKFPRCLYRAKITARPSASNKSPYLVDVVLDNDPIQTPQIAHNPALLCGGRLDKGATVYVMAAPEASKGLSKFQVMLLEAEGTLIITNPQVANQIAAEIIKQGHLGWIPTTLKAEVTHGESRFDFGGSRQVDNKPFFVEVKSAPLLDATGQAVLFPIGNRKHKANDPVSPRAVKHAEHLTALAIAQSHHTSLLFIAMRPDPEYFQISTADITYNNAIRKAHEAGVALCAFSVRPTPEGEVYFEKALDVHI
jgi:DNA-binding sugar fermentation-stimulating protein